MLSMVLAALRSRRSSTIAVWLVACLVVAGAVGAPFDVFGARARVSAQDVADATAQQRTIVLSQDVTVAGAPGAPPDQALVDHALDVEKSALALPHALDITGLHVGGALAGPANTSVEIAYRSGVCARVVVTGRCPAAIREVMVSKALATQLGVRVGSSLGWPAASLTSKPPALRVVGIYDPTNVGDPYWGSGLLSATAPVGTPTADAMLVTAPTIRAYGQIVTVERLLVVMPATVAGRGRSGGASAVDAVSSQLANLTAATGNPYTVIEDFEPLAARIAEDTQTVTNTVPVLAAELILFGWFALYLVLRAIAVGRRAEVGVALLRGTNRVGMWRLFGSQNAVPVLAAIPFGAVAGYVGARWLAGPVPSGDRNVAVAIAAVATTVVVLGALVAAAAAERLARRGSIVEMLRRAPARRRGWRTDAADAAVVALALFAFVQWKLGGTPEGGAVGVAAATPALLAVAVALVAARFVAPAAAAVIPAALRSGRAVGLLSAAHLARRPGIDRIFALLVIAVALVGDAVLGWHTAATAGHSRAVQELGADRVLQIRNASAQRVLTVTRTADPTGRYAMAVAAYPAGDVLAVDSTRLATVLDDGGGWPSGRSMAAALAVAPLSTVRFGDGALLLDATATRATKRPVDVAVDMVDPDGTAHAVLFGPLTSQRNRYQATVAGCAAGCTFVDLRVIDAPSRTARSDFPVSGVSVVVSALGSDSAGVAAPDGSSATGVTAVAGAPTRIDRATFADRTRWRTSIDDTSLGPALSTGPDGLHIVLPTGETRGSFNQFDPRVYPIDVALPVPVVAAGALPASDRPGLTGLAVFDDLTMPVRVAHTAAVLPQLGTSGRLVDLSTALRLDGSAGDGAEPQVWLRADAPASVTAKLRAAGLQITADTSIGAAQAGYRRQAPYAGLRFGLAIAAIALLVGVIALVALATVERSQRSAELTALRRDGLAPRSALAVAYASYAWLAGGAVVVGLVAVIAAHVLVGRHIVVFSDRYAIPPAPHATAYGWVLVVVAMALPLTAATAFVANRLVRASRGRIGGVT